MDESSRGLHGAAAYPMVYATLRRVMSGHRYWMRFTSQHVRPTAKHRILDIGCGPGQVSKYMRGAEYIGFDWSRPYIKYARRVYGSFGQFHCMDVREANLPRSSFDVVVAMGVLHHLDDELAEHLLALAGACMKPSGRLITVDTSLRRCDPVLTRLLVRCDRGQHVRSPEKYARLAERHFAQVLMTVRRDLLRSPIGIGRYTMTVLECQQHVSR